MNPVKFTVNDNYAVRFGMGRSKEWEQGSSDHCWNRKDGKYKSVLIWQTILCVRPLQIKRWFWFRERLRSQYFHDDGDGITFYEKAIRYALKFQENENSSQVSLFGKKEWCSNWAIIPPCETGHHVKTGQRKVRIYIRTSIRWLQIWDEVFCNANLGTEKFRATCGRSLWRNINVYNIGGS
jgi:hypothetical protein